MQTFLPYADFYESAVNLDKKRLFKQVVEAKQLLCGLHSSTIPEEWKSLPSYINRTSFSHPACKMWEGYEDLLTHYYNVMLYQCLLIKINTKMPYLNCEYSYNNDGKLILQVHKYYKNIHKPFWLGDDNFHRSHRARLYEKNPTYYHLFSGDKGFNNDKYLWPVLETKTYKII